MSDGKVNVSSSLISAICAGNLTNVTKLVLSHGLSCCEGLYGSYALLCNTIESGHFEVAKFLLQQGINVAYETDRVSTPLHFATRQNCVELVQLLLDKNAPINARNGLNETALHLAAKDGNVEIVKVLLSNNADVTAQAQDCSTPLLLAVEHGAGEVVRMLLQHACAKFKDEKDPATLVSSGKKSNSSVLNRALLCNSSVYDRVNEFVVRTVNFVDGHSEIIEDLIDYGFVVSREYIDEAFLLAAIEKKYEKLIKSILTITSPNDAKHILLHLHSAVQRRQQKIVELFGSLGSETYTNSRDAKFSSEEEKLVKAVELLMASGANIKEFPDLLHTFVRRKMVEVCKVLIEGGADVNALNDGNESPLHVICSLFGQEWKQKVEKITRFLLNSGADVNMKDSQGRMALHIASGSGRIEAVSVLLECGVDVNLRTESGSTPLHYARTEEIVEILCKNNANLEVWNRKGRTPLHCAAYWQRTDVVEKLLKFGADIEVRGLNNETALHSMFSSNLEEYIAWGKAMATMLVCKGCDANAKTSQGHTVLDMAYSTAESNYEKYLADDEISDTEMDDIFIPEYNLRTTSLGGIKSVKQHLMKLEVAGLGEASQDKFDEIADKLSSFRGECVEEVKGMKEEQLNTEFNLYDALVKSKSLSYTKVDSLQHVLEAFDFQKYPIYGSLITVALERRKIRLNLIGPGRKSLEILIKTSNKLNGKQCIILPVELLELIVSYLSNSDLKSLISCSDALKRQLSL